jgi:hypothetical protein
MREQLNNNPLAQLAVLGALLLAGGVFLMTTMGGGGEEEGEAASSSSSLTVEAPGSEAAPPAEASAAPALPPSTAPPLPEAVLRAWEADQTVVLLFVRDGGIDDHLVEQTSENLNAFPDVTRFVVPAAQISRYGAITEGLGIERVPALVTISPRRLGEQVPTASVHYGFQTRASVAQAVIDAGYEGRTLPYHP